TYADAWARLASAQTNLRTHGLDAGDEATSLKRALEINPNSASARSAKAKYLARAGDLDGAIREIEIAQRLDPDSFEVATRAADIYMMTRRYREAIAALETFTNAVETDFSGFMLMAQCQEMLGEHADALSAARRCVERVDAEMARDPANGEAL